MSVRLCVHKCDTRHTEGGEKIALKKKESHNLFHQYNDEFVSLLYLVSNNKKMNNFDLVPSQGSMRMGTKHKGQKWSQLAPVCVGMPCLFQSTVGTVGMSCSLLCAGLEL